ncbi:MAG: UDP-N-acetylglucosamine 1-carboxyvinyltransferase [Candidatus Sungbacteria bacterium RIFCSPLOWO2_01_FULL_60_25]|uniref:UDP-N-acetylglucosamine 1-carboxyvinyltransferase n=1 Tax=Candidatus Sungbacteria bacterium RIFCSPLOWO2_01_FULL_60_25 TaxID=1802281 RepID=A0A1G2LB30_9BACT|nr:MAG: UDP-N-acetylglucosamine 1-carboxyvinyltransferase [Candidatus Sungbacteria bacterium RIFCSPLOWO2_01_FULL_60_25]
MQQLRIIGGRPLVGEVRLAGTKNSINKVLIASLLTPEPVRFENVPAIGETDIVVELCQAIGSNVTRSGDVLTIETPEITNPRVKELSRKNRIPILAIGPLLVRAGVAEVPTVGGDQIGPRPVDFHLAILEKLGATIEVGETIRAAAAGLHGNAIVLPYPSVGATETAILSAACARGLTHITNAATEPEVTDLIKLLQKMGAIIEIGTNRSITIEGVPELHGAEHRIMPDRNEATSFAVMALATGGDIVVEEAVQEHLITFLNAVRRIGGDYEIKPDGIRFFRRNALRPIHIETDTHPGFMTDWQQPFSVLLTQAPGESIVHETVYEDRFNYTEDLRQMGADIAIVPECLGSLPCRFRGRRYNHTALIKGGTPLHATEIAMRDIRAGMAHIIAALIAEGATTINGLGQIDRGYERIDERIRNLGGNIRRM